MSACAPNTTVDVDGYRMAGSSGKWRRERCAGNCQHAALVRRPYTNGSIATVLQCKSCGGQLRFVSKAEADAAVRSGVAIGEWSDDLVRAEEERAARELEEWKEAQRTRALQERAERRRFYDEYIMSPAWRAKRLLALKRDNHTCQGCMSRSANHVHHKTYEHLGDELLFELVSLCEPCHEKIHPHMRRGGEE